MDPYIENIEEEVYLKNNTVTYKWLLKHVKVSSNVAKQMLYEFVEKQKAANVKVGVTYFVSGARKAEDGSMAHEVYIVPEESVESTKAKLAVVTSVHIYAVHKAQLQDPSVLFSTDYHIFHQSLANDSGWGYPISCPNMTFRQISENKIEVKSESVNVYQKTPNESSTTTTNTTPVEKPSTKQNSGVLGKMFSKMSQNEKAVKKVVAVEEKQVTAKLADKNASENATSITTIPTPKPLQTKTRVPKKRAAEEPKKYTVKSETSNVKKRRRIIEMSDSSDDDSDSSVEKEPEVKVPMLLNEPDFDDPEDPLPPLPTSKSSFKEEKQIIQNQVRHKRTLVEETTLDKDGYLVTSKFWKDETENEVVKENKPLPVENEIQKEKPVFRQKQSTLMNFFKKK